MRIGLVGYGTGGQHFHAPFIEAAKGVTLAAVVARAPETIAKVKADFPELPVYSSLTDMIASGSVDAVTITTPPATRQSLVLEALDAGLHVIADKPFAPDVKHARILEEKAQEKGVVLGVFHNRRFDTDVLTLKKTLDSGVLGELSRLHTRFDLDDQGTLEKGPEGGLLRDLGSHQIDQILHLLGPVESVYASLDNQMYPEGLTNVSYCLTLKHTSGITSHVSASKLNYQVAKEFIVYGESGSYYSNSTDVQAAAIFAGDRPKDNPEKWGIEEKSRWPVLATAEGKTHIRCEQGNYHDYYSQFALAVKNGDKPPVTPADAIAAIEVMEAAYESAGTNQAVKL